MFDRPAKRFRSEHDEWSAEARSVAREAGMQNRTCTSVADIEPGFRSGMFLEFPVSPYILQLFRATTGSGSRPSSDATAALFCANGAGGGGGTAASHREAPRPCYVQVARPTFVNLSRIDRIEFEDQVVSGIDLADHRGLWCKTLPHGSRILFFRMTDDGSLLLVDSIAFAPEAAQIYLRIQQSLR